MPEVSQVHIDAALVNVSVAYQNPDYIAARLAPEVPVRKQSDHYYIYDPEREAMRRTDDQRAPGTEANEVDFALSTDRYYCDDHALESAIPDEERANADPPLQPDIDRVEFLTNKILLNQEIALSQIIRTPGAVPGETLSGTDQWSDYDDSDPLGDIEAARGAIQQAAQVMPNTLVLPYDVYVKLRFHPAIADKVQFSGVRVVGPDVLAQVFDVERVLVARAFQNTAAPGQAPSLEYVWGKDALLCHVPQRPGLKQVGLAYTFLWTQASGAVQGRLVEAWREHRRKADMVRVQKYYDQKLIAPAAAYLWKNAVS